MGLLDKLFGGGKKSDSGSGQTIVYRTGPADTCRSLAKTFYGDESQWEKIYKPNEWRLKEEVQSGSRAYQQKDYAKALKHYDRASSLCHHDRAHKKACATLDLGLALDRGRIFEGEKRYAEAMTEYQINAQAALEVKLLHQKLDELRELEFEELRGLLDDLHRAIDGLQRPGRETESDQLRPAAQAED